MLHEQRNRDSILFKNKLVFRIFNTFLRSYSNVGVATSNEFNEFLGSIEIQNGTSFACKSLMWTRQVIAQVNIKSFLVSSNLLVWKQTISNRVLLSTT